MFLELCDAGGAVWSCQAWMSASSVKDLGSWRWGGVGCQLAVSCMTLWLLLVSLATAASRHCRAENLWLQVFHREVAARLSDPQRMAGAWQRIQHQKGALHVCIGICNACCCCSWCIAGYTAVFDTVAVSRTGNFTCPVRCGALLVGSVTAATHPCSQPAPPPVILNRSKASGRSCLPTGDSHEL